MNRLLRSTQALFAIAALTLALQGCAPPSQAVKPIAAQNLENITALTKNTRVLLALYEPLLQASSQVLINYHIANTKAEFIGVVGVLDRPMVPSWEDAVKQNRGAPYRFRERYEYVKSAVARGLPASEIEEIKFREGWIYLAATDPEFTPAKLHGVVKRLLELQRATPLNSAAYYISAENILLPNDPALQRNRQVVEGAALLLSKLKEELLNELNIASLHSQALSGFADSKLDLGKTLTAMNNNDIKGVLAELSNEYIKDETYRKAVVSLLTKGVDSLTGGE